MKKNIKFYLGFILTILSVFIFYACDTPNSEIDNRASIEKVEPTHFYNTNRKIISGNQASKLMKKSGWGIFQDWSKEVEIVIWEASGRAQHPVVHCSIDPEYVLIGGGAYVKYDEPGALLTASYPENDQLETWVAKSKDHEEKSVHTLYSYAIGLRLKNLDRQTLLDNIIFKSRTSTTQAHPSSQVSVPLGYVLIGGGANVNWTGYGSLLTESYPYNKRTWKVKSKDHLESAPSSITAYAIGIKENIKGFGKIEVAHRSNSVYQSRRAASVGKNITNGWVLSCPGGKATWKGKGRLLTRIAPNPFNNTEIIASSKDHMEYDGGTTTVSFVEIRKVKK